jgi:hypothetical protein
MLWCLFLFVVTTTPSDILISRTQRLLQELESLAVLGGSARTAERHPALLSALHSLSGCVRPILQGLSAAKPPAAERDFFCSTPLEAFRRPELVAGIRALVCDGGVRRFAVLREGSDACAKLQLQQRPRLRSVEFVHVAKTGGEFVQKVFGLMKNHRFAAQRWNSTSDGKTHALVITVQRNPLDRLASWFRFCCHGHRTHLPKPRSVCRRAIDLLNSTDDSRAAFSAWLPFALHSPVPTDERAEVALIRASFKQFITLADGTLAPDFVLRFEHFEDDLRALLCMLGATTFDLPRGRVNGYDLDGMMEDADVPRVRQLYATDWLALFSADAIRLAESHFADDLSLGL